MTLMPLGRHRADSRRATREVGAHPPKACIVINGYRLVDLYCRLLHDSFSDLLEIVH